VSSVPTTVTERIAFVGGPVLAAAAGLAAVYAAGLPEPAGWTAAVTVLCAVWWIFEPIPLAATALIPFAAFPLCRVLTHQEVATAYGHHLVLLMLAGSIVATAMEKSGAHRRVAISMVRLVGGGGPRRLVLGFLLAAAGLSMWMSNTATTVMLLPVALAVIQASRDDSIAIPLLLAVTYGSSIGGSGTPIGTPPNLILLSQYKQHTGIEPSFLDWMGWGMPVVVVMLPIAWLWLTRRLTTSMTLQLPKLGGWTSAERRVLVVFALTALAWMTRSEPFGGWSRLVGAEGYAGDSTVAIAAAVVLFVMPSGNTQDRRLLDWETAAKIPWGVFIMIGGGIAIGKAFDASQLDASIGRALGFLIAWPTFVVVPLLCLVATFTTEVTSNTAVANVLMPILAAAAVGTDADPLWLMLPAVLGINHAFMLPVATAPNAIVYGTGKVTTAQMAKEGLALNLAGAVVITGVSLALLR
jgi:sodium-dependent dicarboxylate transporter 2/3/5